MNRTSVVNAMLLAALGLASTLSHAGSLADVKKANTIVIATTSSGPPHGYKDPVDSQYKGIMVEVAEGVAKRLGVTPKFVDVPFPSLIPTLTSGRADLMASALFITEERAKVIDFTSAIYGWGEGIAQSEKTKVTYSNVETMKGAKIGTLADSVQYRFAKEIPGSKVSTYTDYPTLLADIRAGRIDLGIIDPPSIVYQIKSKGIPGIKLIPEYQPSNQWRVGMAVQKGEKELLDAVNAAVKDMRDAGEIDAILKKWGVADLTTQ